MNIVYLTWGETPRAHGVYGSQVIKQFKETVSGIDDCKSYFVAAVPLVHSGLTREKFGYIEEIRKVKKLLGCVSFKWFPILCTQNFVDSSRFTFQFMHGFSHLLVGRYIKSLDANIVHCRSYHAAWAALKIRERYSLSYKVIFDARGIWPEEVSLKKGYSLEDKNYLFLKGIERYILDNCDVTVAVSDTMAEYFEELGTKKVETVYLSSKSFYVDHEIVRKQNAPSFPTFCYVGALASNTWHRPEELKRLFDRLLSINPDSKLVIVTTSSHQDIYQCFNHHPNVAITSAKSIDELQLIFSKVDFGLMSYFTPKTPIEHKLSKMVMAVKVAEYLCYGLPVIVNKYCGGASKIIEMNEFGITYDPNNFENVLAESLDRYLNNYNASIQANKAAVLFSYETNAAKYLNLYQTNFSNVHD